MSNNNFTMCKIDTIFKQELEDVAIRRIKENDENKMRSIRRLTKAIRKSKHWEPMKEDLIKSEFEEEDDNDDGE